jgi:hypothetical protein
VSRTLAKLLQHRHTQPRRELHLKDKVQSCGAPKKLQCNSRLRTFGATGPTGPLG